MLRFHAPATSRHQRGRSAVEALVATALGTLTLVLSTTSVLALVANEAGNTAARALASSVQLARAEAARLRRPVALCALDRQSAQLPGGNERCAGGTGPWRAGWIVFEDANRNGRRDDGEAVLQVAHRANLTIRPQATPAQEEAGTAIQFQPFGTLAHSAPLVMRVGEDGEATQSVCIGLDGHVRVTNGSAVCS